MWACIRVTNHKKYSSANIHSIYGPVVNPISYNNGAEKRSAGGSSGGSAASVAMDMCTA